MVDRPPVKTTEMGGPSGTKGDDGANQLAGRKRQLFVETTGLLLTVTVHATNLQDLVLVQRLLTPVAASTGNSCGS